MFYAIEGIDGTGKTSVGRKLELISGFKYVETPNESFKLTNGQPKEAFDDRFDYFMRGNLHAVQNLDRSSRSFLGRYCYSTIISNSLLYGRDINDSERLAKSYNVEDPFQTFLLVVDEAEQVKRITCRNNGKHEMNDYMVLHDSGYRRSMRQYYLEKADEKGWHIIDTTHRSIDQVAEEILRTIN